MHRNNPEVWHKENGTNTKVCLFTFPCPPSDKNKDLINEDKPKAKQKNVPQNNSFYINHQENCVAKVKTPVMNQEEQGAATLRTQ